MRFGYVWLLCMSVTSLCYGAAAQDPAPESSDSVTLRVYHVYASKSQGFWSNFDSFRFVKEHTIDKKTTQEMIEYLYPNDFQLWCYKEGVKCTCTERYTECTCFDHEQHYFAPDLPERWVKTGETVWYGDASPPRKRMVKQPAPLLDQIKHARLTFSLVIAVCIDDSNKRYGSSGPPEGDW